jgi:predicted alpha/beta hydrolase
MMWLLLILLSGLLVALLALLHDWQKRHSRPRGQRPPLTYICHTQDGWELPLYRYPTTNPHPEPTTLVLCADIGEAPYLWEWGKTGGWATQLAEKGYDVWIIALRGASFDASPSSSWGWPLEYHIEYDFPAICETLSQHTENTDIHWLGRGFGCYLPLLHPDASLLSLRSLTWLGAGMASQDTQPTWHRALQHWPFPRFPLLSILKWAAAWSHFQHTLAYWLPQCSQKPAAPLPLILWNGHQSCSTPALRQWRKMCETGHWTHQEGMIDGYGAVVQARLRHNQTPTFALAPLPEKLPHPALICFTDDSNLFEQTEAIATHWYAPGPSQIGVHHVLATVLKESND